MDAMADDLTRPQKETVIRDHIRAMRSQKHVWTLDEKAIAYAHNEGLEMDEDATLDEICRIITEYRKQGRIPQKLKDNFIKEVNDYFDDNEAELRMQNGEGTTNATIKEDGMTGQDIETILQKKLHTYIPVIASDEIPTLCKYINKNTKEFGFIINSDPHDMPGHHWRSIYINRARAEICYYDSLTSDPSEECLRGLKALMKRMDDPLYYVLKINKVKYQSNTTATCGAFALKFLDDMYHGKKFKEATGYDDHVNGEKDIKRYISRWPYI